MDKQNCNIFRIFFSLWFLGQLADCVPRKYKRCAASIFNYNGVEVLLGESLIGRVVVLYLMKRRCERLCFSQLQGLNDLGAFYNKTHHKVTIIALKPRNSPPVDHFRRYLPFVGIFEEPRSAYTPTRIIRRLRGDGGWREILIYGRCGEQRFHYGYPYSSLTEPFINYAILYTLTFPKKCEPC